MSERQHTRDEEYQQTRQAFEGMRLEDRAVFLLEAAVTTVAHGVEAFGRVVVDEIDRALRTCRPADEAPEEPAASAAPPPDVPPSSKDSL